MGESKKAILGLIAIFSAVGAFIVWKNGAGPGVPASVVLPLRIAFPLVFLASGAPLLWAFTRKDIEPDIIRQIAGRPFERDGLCFCIIPRAYDGVMCLNIVFQNQYASACDARVVVSPPLKSFSLGGRQFPAVAVDIQCDGGAVGVVRTAFGVPAKFQGRRILFEVAAATKYRGGRGQLLRFRNGMRVGKANSSGLGAAVVAAAVVTAMSAGSVLHSTPASIAIDLAQPVSEETPQQDPVARTLWRPGDSADNVAAQLQQALT